MSPTIRNQARLAGVTLAAGLLFGTVFGSDVALAQGGAGGGSPHFIRCSADIDQDGNLVVSFKEAGLGNDVENVVVEATANATATYQCVNNGKNCPQAENKMDEAGPVTGTGEFPVRNNGQVTGSLTIGPPPSTLDCPGNQFPVVEAVEYTEIQVTDTDNGVSCTPRNTSLSTTFQVCRPR